MNRHEKRGEERRKKIGNRAKSEELVVRETRQKRDGKKERLEQKEGTGWKK